MNYLKIILIVLLFTQCSDEKKGQIDLESKEISVRDFELLKTSDSCQYFYNENKSIHYVLKDGKVYRLMSCKENFLNTRWLIVLATVFFILFILILKDS